MCSEICPSPRTTTSTTTFSYDLQKEPSNSMIFDSSISDDFEFSFSLEFDSHQSSADELFANGMILPVFHRAGDHRRASLPPLPTPKDLVHGSVPGSDAKPVQRPFWRFKRSASLSHNGSDKKGGLIWQLPVLSRSKSTGSVPNPNRAVQKQQPQPSIKMAKSSSFSGSSSSSFKPSVSGYNGNSRSGQKPLLISRSCRINPVLNLPSPYIIGTANLFGLGSLFCNGKDKKKIRR